mmetsp:Transcript_47561/g.136760  ORF Transcript_47561/g.136760 Transcript_47561/m.136760 type:complete len:732 (+) Transcript_47561:62-2257(+)
MDASTGTDTIEATADRSCADSKPAAVSSNSGPASSDDKSAQHDNTSACAEELSEEDLLSVDQVSQMMREQDADLLERMHHDASMVSQYSSGRTPDLSAVDGFFMGDQNILLPQGSLRNLYEGKDAGDSPSESRVASFQDPSSNSSHGLGPSEILNLPLLRRLSEHRSQHSRTGSLGVVKENDASITWEGEIGEQELRDEAAPSGSRFRRLLSGEIRNFEPEEDQAVEEEEEEETTASPVSVAHEAASAALEQQQKKETGLAEQRRVREAMQFAEAVGEHIAINRDELRIIEDHTDEGESDDDDDDGCESKEIVVNDQDASQENIGSSQRTMEMMNTHANFQDAQDRSTKPLPSHVDVPQRKSKRPVWPFGPAGSDYDRFFDNLSDGSNRTNFVYKGICANPPEITTRGIQRGNYAQLHRKAWLEVSDKYHRYGKNLRLYYRYWERLGFPTNQFFDWLDSKGEAAGQPLPNLDECPRSVLDSDTVLYITNPEVTEGYALDIVCNEEGRARIFDVDGRPVATGQEGWIFVLRDGVMYGAEKITSISGHSKQRFHHSSFFGGKAVAGAGIIITDEEGFLDRLYPHSGHYRPGEAHMQRMLFFLHRKGVDLRTFEMDTQQFRHVSRDKDAGKSKDTDGKKEKPKDGKESEKKVKKVDSLHMEKAVNVACFLCHKANFIGTGIFDSIHKIRKADATSVSEALALIDNGGYWRNRRDDGESVSNNDPGQVSDPAAPQ